MVLERYGWDSHFKDAFLAHSQAGMSVGRIIREDKTLYHLFTSGGIIQATLAGKLRKADVRKESLPVVGDWAVFEMESAHSLPVIQSILPRKTVIQRLSSGNRKRNRTLLNERQLIAANMDYIFIVSALDRDFNLRRLERYLTLVFQSEARPVLILNKSDLVSNPEDFAKQACTISKDVPVHCVSALTGFGLSDIESYLDEGVTIALLGSSGVGKSSLINTLLGRAQLATREISEQLQKGKHTTTHRELIEMPQGGLIMDNPGIRELQLWGDETSMDDTFQDISEFAAECRFSNCRHDREPSCAVRAAVENGQLSDERYRSFLKQQSELTALDKKKKYYSN